MQHTTVSLSNPPSRHWQSNSLLDTCRGAQWGERRCVRQVKATAASSAWLLPLPPAYRGSDYSTIAGAPWAQRCLNSTLMNSVNGKQVSICELKKGWEGGEDGKC